MKIEKRHILKFIKHKLTMTIIMVVFLLLLNYFEFEFQKNTRTIILLAILIWWLKQILYITVLNFRGTEFLNYLESQSKELSKPEFRQLTTTLREDFESVHPRISLYNGWVTVISAMILFIAVPVSLIYVNIN